MNLLLLPTCRLNTYLERDTCQEQQLQAQTVESCGRQYLRRKAQATQLETQRPKSVETATIIIIAAFILFGCFGRTVVTGKELSKLPVLASEDYFFNNTLRFTFHRPRFDPSLYQFHIPFQLYAQKEMSNLRLPLWNPCFGCGFPTLGELQYCTFSPFRGIFQAANPYLYNLGIAIKSLIAALSMFMLCRLFSFSRGAAAFGAIAYGLSPFILRELELPNEVQMFPLLASAFVYLGNSKSFIKVALLGASTAVAIASMHPEFFFLATFNSLLIMLAARKHTPAAPPEQVGKNIFLAGIIGICLSAPLLLPFMELVANADSYKFHEFAIQKNTALTLIAGLITPVNTGGSVFIGVIAILTAVFAIVFGHRKNLGLLAIALFLGVWCCLPSALEKIQVCSLIPPRYLHAPLLMVLTLLSAHGIDSISEQIQSKSKKALICLTAIALVLALAPFLLLNSHMPLPGYDGTLPVPAILKSEALKGAVSIGITLALIAIAYFAKLPKGAIALLPFCLLGANLLSLGDSSRAALPPTFPFSYRDTGAIKEIRKSGERMSAACHFVFFPNIALSYGLRDFRIHGPLIPRSIAALHKLNRAKTADSRSEKWSNRGFTLPTVYDTASVQYLITRWPINSIADKPLNYKPFACLNGAPQHLLDPVVMKNGEYCLSTNGEVFCKFDWELIAKDTAHLAAEIDVLDESGKILARGDRSEVGKVGESESTQLLSILIPEFQQRRGNIYLVLNLYSALAESMLPLKTSMPIRANGVELLKVTPQDNNFQDLSYARLRFVKEDNEGILLYKNTKALPQAYLALNVVAADSLNDAFQKMKDSGFDAHLKTIIEAPAKELQLQAPSDSVEPALIERPDAQTVLVKTKCDREAFLILTDTFYNGWHSYVDGHEVPMYRANVNFRAVKVPAGEHQIRFEYIPLAFYAGLAIAAATLAAIAGAYLLKLRNNA